MGRWTRAEPTVRWRGDFKIGRGTVDVKAIERRFTGGNPAMGDRCRALTGTSGVGRGGSFRAPDLVDGFGGPGEAASLRILAHCASAENDPETARRYRTEARALYVGMGAVPPEDLADPA